MQIVRLFLVNLRFHYLKAKGISDFKGEEQEFSMHKSRLMMERYNRTPEKVKVIDFSSVMKHFYYITISPLLALNHARK